MKTRVGAGALALGALATIGLSTAAALTADASAATPTAVTPAACALHASGYQSTVGEPFPQYRWTERFSNNCASVRVRAVVVCSDNFDGVHHTEYGGTINGNGTSYYTCNAVQAFVSGHGQYYNGVKWINLKT